MYLAPRIQSISQSLRRITALMMPYRILNEVRKRDECYSCLIFKIADLSRTSIKLFSSSKRQSHKHSHSHTGISSPSHSMDEQATYESDLSSDVATNEDSDEEGNGLTTIIYVLYYVVRFF